MTGSNCSQEDSCKGLLPRPSGTDKRKSRVYLAAIKPRNMTIELNTQQIGRV